MLDGPPAELLLIEPPAGRQFPPPSALVPSPHCSLFLAANPYAPCLRLREEERTYALMRSTAEAESTAHVRYDAWQRARRKQERSTIRQARDGQSGPTEDSYDASAQRHRLRRLSELTPGSSSSASRAQVPQPPQPHHPLFASLPEALRRLDDPLSIRAFIEAQKRALAAEVTATDGLDAAVDVDVDEFEDDDLDSQPVRFVSFEGASTPLAPHVRRNIEPPPAPDPDPEGDEYIRYAKNCGYVVLVRPEQISGSVAQPPSSSSGASSAGSPHELNPYQPADPLGHLSNTCIHPLHPANLLSVLTKEYAHRRQKRQLKRHQRLQRRHGQSFSPSPPSPSPQSDSGSDSGSEDELDDDELETKGTGVLEPTLYCGSRGSITSMHAENDQLCSFHQLAAGIKIWFGSTNKHSLPGTHSHALAD